MASGPNQSYWSDAVTRIGPWCSCRLAAGPVSNLQIGPAVCWLSAIWSPVLNALPLNPPMAAGRNVEQLFMTRGTARPPRIARYARAPSRSEPVLMRVPAATGKGLLIGSDVLVREP